MSSRNLKFGREVSKILQIIKDVLLEIIRIIIKVATTKHQWHELEAQAIICRKKRR
jgi:hypothetical protein